ncbi:3-hydroxyacyl-CoA dehydrogenase [Aspergillus sclerotioniger CBS 115572]|uniref:3-hydroxyacyl-CoA dehydrogenase n=1 Tax=Aspergillus sclerotioniger CBS 115572 TaxID=1450535 RepID=A0A317X4S9_9EURO|nr:3-hydroxyacyl-CoA dehydrogenase [Aspergillus sclerotioniger CBS 115572]PWY93624.1 3-hydroxyacyl-CoA dehydrogenase [Aspergillus sclerotioniger CBS 115572]
MTRVLNAVTLFGAGTQGSRLAYMWSRLGRPVYLVDRTPAQLNLALATVERLRASNPPSEPGQVISLTTDELDKALHNSWLAIECVPEDLDCKRPVMEELDRRSDPETIIASNSSSYFISEICKGLSLRTNDRFVNLHSFWPPETQAIEIMGSSQTRADIIPLLMKETQDHGFQPFHVRKSSTGYTFNRYLANHVVWDSAIHTNHETLLLLEEGIATPEVDNIYKAMDIAGLDEHYAKDWIGIPNEPRKVLREMIERGDLGVKSGNGFFHYT